MRVAEVWSFVIVTLCIMWWNKDYSATTMVVSAVAFTIVRIAAWALRRVHFPYRLAIVKRERTTP